MSLCRAKWKDFFSSTARENEKRNLNMQSSQLEISCSSVRLRCWTRKFISIQVVLIENTFFFRVFHFTLTRQIEKFFFLTNELAHFTSMLEWVESLKRWARINNTNWIINKLFPPSRLHSSTFSVPVCLPHDFYVDTWTFFFAVFSAPAIRANSYSP